MTDSIRETGLDDDDWAGRPLRPGEQRGAEESNIYNRAMEALETNEVPHGIPAHILDGLMIAYQANNHIDWALHPEIYEEILSMVLDDFFRPSQAARKAAKDFAELNPQQATSQ